MKTVLFATVASFALIAPGVAFAQSTGTIDAEEEVQEIVVTGSQTRDSGVAGIEIPDTPKARTVLTNEYLRTQNPGQSVIDTLNVVPSVNFTNNDPFGSSGGNVRIRGFDGNRISLTFDGLPLNDTGNYAIFSNQQLDPEVIESVNVNQGTTDVDSPTAASSGGTINYRSLVPSEEFGATAVGSYGLSYKGREYTRAFGLIQTGDILGTGIRGFVSASRARADKYRGFGDLVKEQYNARLYKVLNEDNGDFIALAGHYNRNRNTSFRSLSYAQALRDLADDGRFGYDNNQFCVRPTFGAGAQNEANTLQGVGNTQINVQFAPNGLGSPSQSTLLATVGNQDNSCTNYNGVRINPSNTGNARLNSKFTLTDKLTFTLDAGYQYTLANGGGFTTLSETDPRARGYRPGALTGGADFSGDGDTSDTVAFYTPNTTNTNRYTVLSSLRYDFTPDQYVRIAYAFDKGRHRQTGEWTGLDAIGNPLGVFGGRGGAPQVVDSQGFFLRQRDRFSIALLNQVSGEYRGRFFDRKLEVVLGVRAPFFHRELNQFCYTQLTTGNPLCTNQAIGTTPLAIVPISAPGVTPVVAGNALNYLFVVPNSATLASVGGVANAVYAPFRSTYNYRKILPNVGLTFRPVDNLQIFAAYAKGLSAPRTDNLYRAPTVNVAPETSDNFDLGVRYTQGRVQASFGGFYNRFTNRIQQTTDTDVNSPTFNLSIDRNVGTVELKGLEASIDVRPFDWFTFRGFGSYIDARYKDNLVLSPTLTLPLAGKRLVETPEWQYGYRAQFRAGPASLGLEFKHRTSRAATDLNDLFVPAYNTFDIDARINLDPLGMKNTFIQLNVDNIFDRQYLGSITSQQSTVNNFAGLIAGQAANFSIPGGNTPTFQPGAPRSFVLSLQVGF